MISAAFSSPRDALTPEEQNKWKKEIFESHAFVTLLSRLDSHPDQKCLMPICVNAGWGSCWKNRPTCLHQVHVECFFNQICLNDLDLRQVCGLHHLLTEEVNGCQWMGWRKPRLLSWFFNPTSSEEGIPSVSMFNSSAIIDDSSFTKPPALIMYLLLEPIESPALNLEQ